MLVRGVVEPGVTGPVGDRLASPDRDEHVEVGGPRLQLESGRPTLFPDRPYESSGERAFTGKVEVGQGTRRALRLIVAEELEVALTNVGLVMGDTDLCPFDIGTFGSLSMRTAATDLQRAAAAAREVLSHGDELAPGMRRLEVVEREPRLTPAHEWHIAGHQVVRGDPDAVTGTKRFASDLSRPEMGHARILRPPQFGARLRSIDDSAARSLPGVTVGADGDFIAVVAPTPDAAGTAIEAIHAEWDPGDTVSESDLWSHLRAHPTEAEGWPGPYAKDLGDFDQAIASAQVRINHTYTTSYIAHAPLETRVAVAEWEGERLTVWTGTHQPFNVRHALAEALDVQEDLVRVIVPDTGAGFGGKHAAEVAIATARLVQTTSLDIIAWCCAMILPVAQAG